MKDRHQLILSLVGIAGLGAALIWAIANCGC